MPTPTEIPNRLQLEVIFVFQEVVKWEVLHGYQILSNHNESTSFQEKLEKHFFGYQPLFLVSLGKLVQESFSEFLDRRADHQAQIKFGQQTREQVLVIKVYPALPAKQISMQS